MGADGAFDRLGAIAGGFVGDVADLPVVRLAALAIGTYATILWLATAWWAMHDLRRRHEEPALPYLAAALVILGSPLLFPLALIVYLIVRPSTTLAERRHLELEARLDELEADVGAGARCPTCSGLIEEDWLRCPTCRERLGYACAGCGRAMGADWHVCAWCAAEAGGHRGSVASRGWQGRRRVVEPASLPVVARRA